MRPLLPATITALVDQMLAIVRLRQNYNSFEEFDLGPVGGVDDKAGALGLGVDLHITYVPPPAPVRMRGNRRAIESAVTNLIDTEPNPLG